jgi:ubiquinone/menaquinone biosynthesis C-methylase UbiE
MKSTCLLLIAASALLAQVAKDANRAYTSKEGRENIAKTLADPHRDGRQKPAELMTALEVKPGMSVADVGTGVGYLLPWLSKAVGPSGKVVGEDIQLDFMEKAQALAKEKNLTNVTFVVGSEKDPKLPENSMDLILTLDVYHHFDYPPQMLASISKALKSGGRFAIVDFYKRPEAMPSGNAMQHIRLDIDDVIREVEENGFKHVKTQEHIPRSQYIAIFVKK